MPSNQYARLLRFSDRHPFVFDLRLLPAPFCFVCYSDLLCMTIALFISITIPTCSLVPMPFGFLARLLLVFLTIFLLVHRISDYLAIEPLHIKYNVFCILPGLHLVPFPNVTSRPHGIVRVICVCEGDSETWSLILITLLTLCFLAACYGYQK